MKNNRQFPLFIMLVAALVAVIIMYRGDYDLTELLIILLLVMLVFYLAGVLIQKKVLSFMDQIREKEKLEAEKEGEVIEKGASTPEGEEETEKENKNKNEKDA